LFPYHADYIILKANIFADLNRFDEAITECDKLFSRGYYRSDRPHDLIVLYVNLLHKAERYKVAIEFLDNWRHKDSLTHELEGDTFMQMAKPKAAFSEYSLAKQLPNANPELTFKIRQARLQAEATQQ
jgi:predicted negative regulator of RcsB-dependent stress response